MKKIFYTLIAVLMISSFTAASGVAETYDSDSGVNWCEYTDGFELSLINEKPIMLEFYQVTCIYCIQQEDTYLDEGVIAESKKFVCIRVDVDKDPELKTQYEVGISPMLFFIMPNGSLISIISGVIEPADLILNMTEALNYFETNYVASEYKPVITDDNTDKSEDSTSMLPLILIGVTAVVAILVVVRFVVVMKKSKKAEKNQLTPEMIKKLQEQGVLPRELPPQPAPGQPPQQVPPPQVQPQQQPQPVSQPQPIPQQVQPPNRPQ